MADNESFSFVRLSMKVPKLQNFLQATDIQIAVDGRKRKGLTGWSFTKMQPKCIFCFEELCFQFSIWLHFYDF